MRRLVLMINRLSGRTGAICLALGLATLACYWPVKTYDFLNYDDPYYVTGNFHVLSGLSWANAGWAFTSVHSSNWHPLTWLSHMLDCQLFAQHAGAHHLVSVFFHSANALMLFLVLQRMTGAVWRSAFLAALFALHPMHVESVAWISERKDVLSTFFFLLTLGAYAGYASRSDGRQSEAPMRCAVKPEESAASETRNPKPWHNITPKASRIRLHASLLYLLALVSFALGLMSKPMLVTLPFVLLLLDHWPLGRLQLKTKNLELKTLLPLVWEKVPFLALSLVSSVITLLAQRQEGAMVSLEKLSLAARMDNALISYVRYAWKLLWPKDLAVLYPHPSNWPGEAVIGSAILLLAVSAAVLWQGRRRPYLVVGWLWFLGTLVPVIGLVQVGIQSMADRYSYVPSLGFFLMLVWGLGDMGGRWRGWPRVWPVGAGLALAASAFLTVRQVQFWQNSGTLFRHAIETVPGNYRAYHNLGLHLFAEGKLDEAIANYRQAVNLAPSFDEALNNLGAALMAQNKLDEALTNYTEALRYHPANAQAHNNLGILLARKERTAEAIEQFVEALRLDPDNAPAHANLGRALASQGRQADALVQFQAALELWPDDPETRCTLGKALMDTGNLEEAIRQQRLVLRANPSHLEARNNLGVALAKQGKLEEAIGQFREAIRADPNYAGAHHNLAKALAVRHEIEPAIAQYRELLRLRPKDAQARQELGSLLAENHLLAAAIKQYTEALRLGTTNAQIHYQLGVALARIDEPEQAAEQFRNVLRLEPGSAPAHYQLGMLSMIRQETAEALAHWRQAARLDPQWPEPLNNLAWTLATTPHPEFRNGAEAVQFATRATELAGTNDVRILDTLAAACAEAGHFEEAVSTARKAQSLAIAQGRLDLGKEIEQRLALYRAHQPYREPERPK